MLRSVLTLEQVLAMSPDDAAALWLVRQDAVDDPDDERVFLQWLDADPAHGLAWARACATWVDLAGADEADIEALKQADDPLRWGWPQWRVAAAASIAFVVIAGVMLLASGLGSQFGLGGAPTRIAANPPGTRTILSTQSEQRTVKLADGSTVTLDADTALALDYDQAHRRIELLRGQAFFRVAHDPGRPFVVENAKRSVTALGTQFEVRVRGSALRVILVEGRVRVATGTGGADAIVELGAGQRLDAGPAGVTVTRADRVGAEDWQQGMVSFHDTPLGDAAAELNRHSHGKPLLVRDPEVAGIRVSGAFHVDDARRFARTIAEIYPVRIVETATALEIVSKARGRR
ncbi:FecR domain-containing protein [Sphingomonas sp.]|uniref:FecR family protein n=1 Tax=Sphingomonas sp. TaxID=28214 RepID=UPI001B2B5EB7|nr:FecR domain-containing protein [Sphingomonas sp.]MBO9713382.1 FecR domain-containing protein [Sphingomonas sp.]